VAVAGTVLLVVIAGAAVLVALALPYYIGWKVARWKGVAAAFVFTSIMSVAWYLLRSKEEPAAA